MGADENRKTEKNLRRELLQALHIKEQRKEKARREGDRSVWFGLGMFGLVGWSVAIPTLVGIALGIWLDRAFPGPYSWTLMMLVCGIALGCLIAGYWVKRESRKH
jgi:ATP synthase protein I